MKKNPKRGRRYLELLRQSLSRQIVLYFLPLLLLAVFFHIQYNQIVKKGEQAHLEVIAEHQANTLNLFLRERLVNLANVIDDPAFRQATDVQGFLKTTLDKLRQTSMAFVDLGVVDADGSLSYYEGPIQFTEAVNYRKEAWFIELQSSPGQSIITDIYLGVRRAPHFTIAVRRSWAGRTAILRSALSPEKINDFLKTLEGATEINASVINRSFVFQVVTPRVGAPLQLSRYRPPRQPQRGHVMASESSASGNFAYAWLGEVPWVLIVESAVSSGSRQVSIWRQSNLIPFTAVFFAVMLAVIVVRARQLVEKQLAAEKHEAELSGQLAQAAKLASVGELAAGIAHEINNPLAIIAEEVGLLKDMMDPELAREGEKINLEEHLGFIHDAVFRCRDITRKLLTFVRQTDVKIAPHDLHRILDDVLDGMLANELMMSNINVVREYASSLAPVVTDRNQLTQVVVNLVKNAIDAMPEGGTLTLTSTGRTDHVVLTIKDTGCGMTKEQLEKVFIPFFTTKDPGKGTGLGLSVSVSIVKNFGGNIYVNSFPNEGSTFTVELPYAIRH